MHFRRIILIGPLLLFVSCAKLLTTSPSDFTAKGVEQRNWDDVPGMNGVGTTRQSTQTQTVVAGASVIKQVQQKLKDRGYYEGEVDGIIGKETRQALIHYQNKSGLNATGTVTVATLDFLDLDTIIDSDAGETIYSE